MDLHARYRIDFLTQRELATQAVLRRADEARTAGRVDEAIQRYREALQLDEGSERAQRGLMQLDDQRKGEAAIQQAERMLKAGQTDPARDVLRRAQKDLPGNVAVAAQLKALDERLEGERAGRERAQLAQSAFRKPVTLQFRDANLKMVFEALSRTANVNIIPRPRREERPEDHDLREGRVGGGHHRPDPAAEPAREARAQPEHAVRLPAVAAKG